MNPQSVLIAGGGLAGAAAAAALAKAGRRVTLIEREAGPVDKVCGEFLSVEAQGYLRRLGLDMAALGGERMTRLLVARADRVVETALPFEGLGISRRVLDEALLQHAQACGAVVRRGQAIGHVSTDGGIRVSVSGLGALAPERLFLATGKHEVRGMKREAAAPEDLVGFKTYFRLSDAGTAALRGRVALIFLRGGYAGLQLVEAGKANLCLLVTRKRLLKWPDLLADLCQESAYLARMLEGAAPLLAQPLTIYRVPYGYVYRPKAADRTEIFRLGDQAAVIPSFTGDGMAIALHSAALAAEVLLAGGTAASYHEQFAAQISGQIFRAQALYRVARARPGQAALFGLAKLFPGGLALAARLTRVPPTARLA